MNSNHTLPLPRILVLISALFVSTWVIPGSVAAEETLFSKTGFSQLMEGDVQLASVGQTAGLHMTFKSPSDSRDAFSAVHADHHSTSSAGIHLSVRMPWK